MPLGQITLCWKVVRVPTKLGVLCPLFDFCLHGYWVDLKLLNISERQLCHFTELCQSVTIALTLRWPWTTSEHLIVWILLDYWVNYAKVAESVELVFLELGPGLQLYLILRTLHFFCYTAGFVSKECMLIILLFVNCDEAKYIRVWCRYWWQRVGIKETWGKEFVGGWRKNEVQWISLALAGRRKGI